MTDFDDNNVIYIQCSHCKKGWYGKVLEANISYDKEPKVEKFIIEGLNPTDITKDIMCLNCGSHYTPIHAVEYVDGELIAISLPEETIVKCMPEFVAKALTTCKGK